MHCTYTLIVLSGWRDNSTADSVGDEQQDAAFESVFGVSLTSLTNWKRRVALNVLLKDGEKNEAGINFDTTEQDLLPS